jgi:hypothetical protein
MEALERARVAIDNWAKWINEEYKDIQVIETPAGMVTVKSENGHSNEAKSAQQRKP